MVKKSAEQIVADIGRLCDHKGFPRTNEGACRAVFKALFDGTLEIPAELPKRGRGRPSYKSYKYGTTLLDFAAGREVPPPPRPKWDYRKSLKLLKEIARLEKEARKPLSNKEIVRQLPAEYGVKTERTLRRRRREATHRFLRPK